MDSKLSGGFAIALGIRSFSRPAKPIENLYSGRYTLLESGIPPGGNIRMQFHKYASAFTEDVEKLEILANIGNPEQLDSSENVAQTRTVRKRRTRKKKC